MFKHSWKRQDYECLLGGFRCVRGAKKPIRGNRSCQRTTPLHLDCFRQLQMHPSSSDFTYPLGSNARSRSISSAPCSLWITAVVSIHVAGDEQHARLTEDHLCCSVHVGRIEIIATFSIHRVNRVLDELQPLLLGPDCFTCRGYYEYDSSHPVP